MSAEFNKDEETIYHEAVARPAAERLAYLRETCKDDQALLARVQILLESRKEAGNFLESPILDTNVTLDNSDALEEPGTVIGRYKLLERIGEGGMAVVYMAEQTEPIRRKVALKIIKLGMDTKSVIARFDAERQALAMMDHPNIAKVLDAGATETGRPYFVMELVTGVSITEYCDKNNLSTKERLALFIQVCNAVQHAHQKGIIHRDIKPTNVMVAHHDGKPVPKVIDFGIAKATNQRLTEKTLFTRYAHIIGTPAYMSPEQAELSDLGIDGRSDIYSLGVLLYELLTGTTPFSEEELRKAGYLEMQRIIREEEPAKPSTKLSTLGETLTDIAKHRGCTPDLLTRAVRGDLDWIVMKALEKDRTRRYGGAVHFALDIERHLKHRPVLAHAPYATYRLRKFAQRNRAPIAVAMIVVVFVAVLTAIFISLSHSQRQRRTAESARHWRILSIAKQSFQHGDLTASLARARELLDSGYVKREAGALIDRIVTKARNRVVYYTNQIESTPDEAGNYFHRARYNAVLGEREKVRSDMTQYTTIASSGWHADFSLGIPENLGPDINSSLDEHAAFTSSEGLSLVFWRRGGGGPDGFWMAKRASKDAPWDTPIEYGPWTPGMLELPDVTSYLTADRREMFSGEERLDGYGGLDLWVYKRDSADANWSPPENLGEVVNTDTDERWTTISRDGLELYFDAFDRPGGCGSWDLWVTKRETRDAPWQKPQNLGEKVNSNVLDARPCLSADGLMLFFDSKQPGGYGEADLYFTRRKTREDPWEKAINLGPFINTPAYEEIAYISADGSTLYFDSNRPDGYGDQDIWRAAVISLGGNSGGKDQSFSTPEDTEKDGGKEVLPSSSL